MATGKIARYRRDHPNVPLAAWRVSPRLLAKPLAVIPSARGDGSIVVVLVIMDARRDPMLAPIALGVGRAPNAVLSIHGKEAGLEWIHREINGASVKALPHYVSKGFAATSPQPGSAEAIPSSVGPILAAGTAKAFRPILSARQ